MKKKRPNKSAIRGQLSNDVDRFLGRGGSITEVPKGKLAPIAAKVLMKIMYCARMGRIDLLRAIGRLAQQITRWTELCDQKLHRIIQYMRFSKEHRMIGFIGDEKSKLRLSLFTDADFAGCKATQKSTSGIFMALTGPNSFFPLTGISKKQSCVSHSTPEAELVAMDLGLRTVGLPALTLWETILGRHDSGGQGGESLHLDVYQDNTATSRIAWTGKAPTLRHLPRTHAVCVAWLHENLKKPNIHLTDCHTLAQSADIFTKHFVDKHKWSHNLLLIGIVKPPLWSQLRQVSSDQTFVA